VVAGTSWCTTFELCDELSSNPLAFRKALFLRLLILPHSGILIWNSALLLFRGGDVPFRVGHMTRLPTD